jgi:hypothetical protein
MRSKPEVADANLLTAFSETLHWSVMHLRWEGKLGLNAPLWCRCHETKSITTAIIILPFHSVLFHPASKTRE